MARASESLARALEEMVSIESVYINLRAAAEQRSDGALEAVNREPASNATDARRVAVVSKLQFDLNLLNENLGKAIEDPSARYGKAQQELVAALRKVRH